MPSKFTKEELEELARIDAEIEEEFDEYEVLFDEESKQLDKELDEIAKQHDSSNAEYDKRQRKNAASRIWKKSKKYQDWLDANHDKILAQQREVSSIRRA